MTDSFKTISSRGEGLYKEKGSKFIACAYPIDSESQIKEILKNLHKEHHNARHICYAYKMGYDAQAAFRMNDDGEPSGTAGKPIYGQISSHELTDILIVVIRYFGGTKLGVSGLITAYKSASIEAINDCEIVEVIRQATLNVSYDFALTNEAMRIVKDYKLKVLDQSYDTACHLSVSVRLSDYERIVAVFTKVYGITIEDNDEDKI